MQSDTYYEKFHNLFDEFFDKLNMPRSTDLIADRVTLPDRLGEGTVQRVKLRPGMEIIIADFRLHPVHTLKGSTLHEHNHFMGGIGDILQLPGTRFGLSEELCYLAFLQHLDDGDKQISDKRILFIEISMAGTLFLNYLGNETPEASNKLIRLLDNGSFSISECGIDAVSQLMIRQMQRHWNTHTMRRMYLESKSMELLAMNIHEHIAVRSRPTAFPALRKSDMDKILRAREILLNLMDHPPSLPELSKMVGLNEFKLKAGFKNVFGTTVFGLLRDKRLEKAWLLLEQEHMNVGEAACAVGYSNPSHFALAFKVKYGLNPSEVLRA